MTMDNKGKKTTASAIPPGTTNINVRANDSLIIAAVVFRTLLDLLEACFDGYFLCASEGADLRYLELVEVCRHTLSGANMQGELTDFPQGLPDSLTEFAAACHLDEIGDIGIAVTEPWTEDLHPCLMRYKAAFLKEVARRGLIQAYDQAIPLLEDAMNLGIVAKEAAGIRTHKRTAWNRMLAHASKEQTASDTLGSTQKCNTDYQAILRIIQDCGIEMERHPSIYASKDEEALRDHLLSVLSPYFQSVTGETYNKVGKTDILIRHEDQNIFVAECKFWKGMNGFYKTINQVLSYLTWRDSKAAVICFVRNKELNPVLTQIASETSQHPCFFKDHGNKAAGWFQFEFYLPEDHSRCVSLAILCFHFPQ